MRLSTFQTPKYFLSIQRDLEWTMNANLPNPPKLLNQSKKKKIMILNLKWFKIDW